MILYFSSKYVSGSNLSSLTFVIDDTSSMGNDIDQVRKSATAIFNTVVSHGDESQIDNFIVVTFNDRSYTDHCTDVGKCMIIFIIRIFFWYFANIKQYKIIMFLENTILILNELSKYKFSQVYV